MTNKEKTHPNTKRGANRFHRMSSGFQDRIHTEMFDGCDEGEEIATVLVTGANRRSGLGFSRQHAEDRWVVTATAQ